MIMEVISLLMVMKKFLIMQDRINENDTLVFAPNNNSDGIIC